MRRPKPGRSSAPFHILDSRLRARDNCLRVGEARCRTSRSAQRSLAIDPCATGAVAQGDSVIRATIDRVPFDSTRSLPYRLRSAQGFCFARARRFAETEPLLLQTEAGLRALARPAAPYRKTTVAWLVSLYEQWGKTEQASLWRDRLGGR
jgi:hypothetical protein